MADLTIVYFFNCGEEYSAFLENPALNFFTIAAILNVVSALGQFSISAYLWTLYEKTDTVILLPSRNVEQNLLQYAH